MKCAYLDNQICVRSDGQYRLCCRSLESANFENIKTHTIEEWNSSKTWTQARNNLENGVWPDACRICRLHEEKGIESGRQRGNKTLGPDGITHLDIRFGNSCNLKCISCWPMSSSSIAVEAQEMKDAGQIPLYNVLEIPNFNWADEKTFLRFDDLPLKEVYLTGGEPMMVKNLDKFLERIDPSVMIRFNTNGTIWNPKIEKLLKRFDKVIMSLSLDAASNKINYIRYPSDWNIIRDNTYRYREFCKTDLTPTISILNACYYNEIEDFAKELDVKIYNNLLLDPYWLHVKNAPDTLKLQFHSVADKWKSEQSDEDAIKYFKNEIVKLDTWRNINIKDYLPEVAAAYGFD